MAAWRDDVQRDYEELHARFKGSTVEDFKKGEWFASLVNWLLENYAKRVDGEYIRKQYPGASPANQATKAIKLAAKYNGVAGGLSASAVTALELSSLGPQAIVTVPAAGLAIMSDVAFSTRTQLRTTYDLSVIHGAPLAVNDVEDCYLVFLTAMGVKLQEMAGGLGKAIGPHVVAYNVRRLLRTGLRKALQEGLKKVGGTWLARKLTERALMRLLVPGVSVPISYGFNYYFTKQVLSVANHTMRRRGKVVQPLVRMYSLDRSLPKTFAIKALISVCDTGDADGWGEEQMNALRHCQSALGLGDGDLSELDGYFDRSVASFVAEAPKLETPAAAALVDLVSTVAGLFPDDRHDERYAEAIVSVSGLGAVPDSPAEVRKKLSRVRADLL